MPTEPGLRRLDSSISSGVALSLFALVGAVETGLVFALVALGSYLTFRILDFPDLTVEGSFPLGAAVTAKLMVLGIDPWTATFCGGLAGALASS